MRLVFANIAADVVHGAADERHASLSMDYVSSSLIQ